MSCQFMDKRLSIALQGGRKVSGVLRGFDIFLNLVVDDAFEEPGPNANSDKTRTPIGQVVRPSHHLCDVLELTHRLPFIVQVVRGASVTSMETLER